MMTVYVRDLKKKEGQKLQSLARTSKCSVTMRRALILLASDQGMKAPEIADLYQVSPDYVRKVIHAYHQKGLESVKSGYSRCGRNPVFTTQECCAMLEIATTPPKVLGLPFTHWSLPKLRTYVVQKQVVTSISHEQIRLILKRANCSLQRVKTWKDSPDPEYQTKKNGSNASTKKPQKEAESSV
jgi:transposase